MIEATTLIADVQGEFEGGNSLSVEWDTMIRRAMENVLDNCRPETLKRRVPIYAGLAHDLFLYYCPADVLVPSDLYSNDGLRRFAYMPPAQFYRQLLDGTYTIEHLNGVQFLLVRHSAVQGSLTIDAMDALGGKTGASVSVNEHNFLSGGSSIQGVFDDSGETLQETLDEEIDIIDYLQGVLLLPAYLTTAAKLASIKVHLLSSIGNYYEVTSTADSIGDYLADGWNLIRFDMANKTQTGSPDPEAIVQYKIIGTTEAGETLTIIFDKFTIQKFVPFYLEYYSNKPYVDGDTGALWQSTLSHANNDKININRDVAGILHYEICLLVTQSSTFDKVDSQATTRFSAQLKRKYQAYWDNHPSSEAPLTYSKSPDIPLGDRAMGSLQNVEIIEV